jgi:hypothetical protein
MSQMMACGCVAMAVQNLGNGKTRPMCIVHMTTDTAKGPELRHRKARCAYFSTCKTESASSVELPFFQWQPELEHDRFYCLCQGCD